MDFGSAGMTGAGRDSPRPYTKNLPPVRDLCIPLPDGVLYGSDSPAANLGGPVFRFPLSRE